MTSIELPAPPSKRQKTNDVPPVVLSSSDGDSGSSLRHVGSCDFPLRIIQKSCFVDKSMFIEEVVQSSGAINVILRPPRFGKSLNLSMLRSFFDVNRSHRQMFNGLLIEKNHPEYFEPDGPFGRHPVIYLDLKNGNIHFKNLSRESCICGAAHKYMNNIKEVYKQFEYLLQSDKLSDAQKKEYKDCRPTSSKSMKVLSRLLTLHHMSPCVILVDDYDSVFHSRTEDVDDADSFLRKWFSDMLIRNAQNIYKVVIMGVCSVSWWDDMNLSIRGTDSEQQSPIGVRTWADAEFSDHFGFSDDEVTQLLNCWGCSAAVPQVLSFYSGYITRKGVSLSNPYSIMRYLADRSIQPHLRDQMADYCMYIYPFLFHLLEDRCSPSPRKGVRPDSNSLSIEIKSNRSNDDGIRALCFGFLGLSDEGRFYIPTLESLGCWIGQAFRCGYERDKTAEFDKWIFELCDPLFENCNCDTLQEFQTVMESRLKLLVSTSLRTIAESVEPRCCGFLVALSLAVWAYMNGFHTDIHYEKTHSLLRVVIVDDIKSHIGFIFQFAVPQCNDMVDESAVSALGTPTQTNQFLANYPEVNNACQLGVGMDHSSCKCSVVGYFLKRDTTTGEWGVSETYNPNIIQKYIQ